MNVRRDEMKKRGIFICIEGIDASGKTTQSRRLVRKLLRKGYDAVYTTEPTNGAIGRLIRKHVLEGKKRIPSVVEALLFAADRVEHVQREIQPALKAGKIVVSDRYLYSSLAYQGAAGLDIRWIEEINRWATKPDLAVYLDVPPKVLIERIKRKPSVMETLENQRKVREVYLKLVEDGRLVLVDGTRPIKEVEEEVWKKVSRLLEG